MACAQEKTQTGPFCNTLVAGGGKIVLPPTSSKTADRAAHGQLASSSASRDFLRPFFRAACGAISHSIPSQLSLVVPIFGGEHRLSFSSVPCEPPNTLPAEWQGAQGMTAFAGVTCGPRKRRGAFSLLRLIPSRLMGTGVTHPIPLFSVPSALARASCIGCGDFSKGSSFTADGSPISNLQSQIPTRGN